jgi:small subunit ribosomal protein S18
MATDNQDQEMHQGEEGDSPRKARSRFKKKVLDTRGLNIDYKSIDVIEKFVSKTGKILPRRMTGATARIQRKISREVKRARMANLLPFVKR